MDTGGLTQMSHNTFTSPTGLGMPAGGLASRRGGQNLKPLSIESLRSTTDVKDGGVPTPRTSRSHLLAGLRTARNAPKSASASAFPASAASAMPSQQTFGRNVFGGQENVYMAPKTSLPRVSVNHQGYNPMMMTNQQQYTPEQILAPEIHLDQQLQAQMDPNLYAQLVATNLYLAEQQQRLQQQLLEIQAAAQQFQGLNLNGQASLMQHNALQSLYQQQQQLQNLQQALVQQHQQQQRPQQNIYAYYDPATGQQTYFVDQNQAQQLNQSNVYLEQPSTPEGFAFPQQNAPRVQVSPPPAEVYENKLAFRTNTPPKKLDLVGEPTPLPPPSANAFRRGHKKAASLALNKGMSLPIDDAPKSAGPRSSCFPLSPLPNGYGPGQARAGEHPVRQPRGPPSIDELRAKPTTKHEGSKNFATRTRRSAVHNLVKAGLERRKGASSSGSMSPVSEHAEEVGTPLTDNDSESGHSGSGSLSGDAEPSLASSRTSTSGSWGAIGSDRPSSRQKSRKSVDSLSSAGESDHGSFANVFKHGFPRTNKSETPSNQRKAPMLVLTSAEKRKGSTGMA